MERRHLLTAGSTAVCVSLAGCSGLLGGDSSDQPTEPYISNVGTASNAGQTRVEVTVLNPTDETVQRDLYVRIYEEVTLPDSDESQYEQLDSASQELGAVEPRGPDDNVAPIPVLFSSPNYGNNDIATGYIDVALVPRGETPTEEEYRNTATDDNL